MELLSYVQEEKEEKKIKFIFWFDLLEFRKKQQHSKQNVGKVVIINQHFLTQRGKIH